MFIEKYAIVRKDRHLSFSVNGKDLQRQFELRDNADSTVVLFDSYDEASVGLQRVPSEYRGDWTIQKVTITLVSEAA